ncbi:LysR family transcriptional regulator [Shewanella marina]|uniref:LysR family transcriptional regulator n=1 Tax=Shewanella marina TaxID=487319 RepID=UPI0004715AC7|nr:LysR family transcriptional regulator [Shewanella marina]
MELRALKYFLVVYEQGSVSAAAKHCFISQPSISSAIQTLEQSLHCQLFIRHARGVLPTPAATELYPKAKALIEQEKQIMQQFQQQTFTTPLRLGIMRSMGAIRMSRLLQYLAQHIENLELTLVDPDEPCDAKFMSSSALSSSDQFVTIWQDTYQLALPQHWPLAHQATIKISDLAGLPFINREPCKALDQLKELMQQQGISFTVRANIRTLDYAWPLVTAGVGAALVPDWDEIKKSTELSLKPINHFRFKQAIGLVIKPNSSNPMIQSVINCCHDFAQLQ